MEKSQFFKDLFGGFIWPQVAQKYRLSSVRLNIWPTVNTYAGLYVMIMLRVGFRVNPDSIVYLNVKELLARSRRHASSLCDRNGIRTLNHLLYSVFFFRNIACPCVRTLTRSTRGDDEKRKHGWLKVRILVRYIL